MDARRNRTLIQQRPLPTKLSTSDIIFGQSKRKQNVLKPAGFMRVGQSTRPDGNMGVSCSESHLSRGFNARCGRLGHAIDGHHHDAGSSLVSLAITSIPHNVSYVPGMRGCRPMSHQILPQSSREVLVVFLFPSRPGPRGGAVPVYIFIPMLPFWNTSAMSTRCPLPDDFFLFFSSFLFNKE